MDESVAGQAGRQRGSRNLQPLIRYTKLPAADGPHIGAGHID